MTELLEAAIARLQTLPTDEQDAIATLILEELEEEQRWDDSFARSPDLLAKMAAEAMEEHRSGKTRELDKDIAEIKAARADYNAGDYTTIDRSPVVMQTPKRNL